MEIDGMANEGAGAGFLSSTPVRPMIVTMSGAESSPAELTPRQRLAEAEVFFEISFMTAATSANVKEAGPERWTKIFPAS